jgi:hypothetical protein
MLAGKPDDVGGALRRRGNYRVTTALPRPGNLAHARERAPPIQRRARDVVPGRIAIAHREALAPDSAFRMSKFERRCYSGLVVSG